MKRCPNCNLTFTDDNSFCTEDGVTLVAFHAPRAINPDISPEVEAVILRALSKQREMRQQNAQALTREFIQAATEAFKTANFSGSSPALQSIQSPSAETEPPSEDERAHTLSEEILVEKELEQSEKEAET